MYSTTTKELSISLFMCFRILKFGQIKMIFRGDENFKKIFIANVNDYRYSNLIKLINILKQTAVFCVFSVLCLLCLCARLFICAL